MNPAGTGGLDDMGLFAPRHMDGSVALDADGGVTIGDFSPAVNSERVVHIPTDRGRPNRLNHLPVSGDFHVSRHLSHPLSSLRLKVWGTSKVFSR